MRRWADVLGVCLCVWYGRLQTGCCVALGYEMVKWPKVVRMAVGDKSPKYVRFWLNAARERVRIVSLVL